MFLVYIKSENTEAGFIENNGKDVISVSDFKQRLKRSAGAHARSSLSTPMQVSTRCPLDPNFSRLRVRMAIRPGVAGQAHVILNPHAPPAVKGSGFDCKHRTALLGTCLPWAVVEASLGRENEITPLATISPYHHRL